MTKFPGMVKGYDLNPFTVVRFTGSTREVNKFQLNITK